jgi:hypothetical protein
VAINFSTDVYAICQDTFGRPATFTSASGNSYSGTGRGIYRTDFLDVILEDNSTISDQQTIFDIRADEFPVLPAQDDTIDIPAEPISGLPALGQFQIVDLNDNGGGEITLTLRAITVKQ